MTETPTQRHRLQATNITIQRGRAFLTKQFSLSVGSGEVVALRGPNGCGKTSLLRVLAGLSSPVEGQVLWGEDEIATAADYSGDLLWLSHLPQIKDEFTARENVANLASLDGRPHDEETVSRLLTRVGLTAKADVLSRRLSQGQRKRLSLTRLVHDHAPLWLLDEPFNALDGDGCTLLTSLLTEQQRRGGICVLATHLPLAMPATEVNMGGT
jgi:heme exporter protein A